MKFKEYLDYFDNKKLKKGERLVIFLLSFLLSLAIVSGPLVISFNLITFTDYVGIAALFSYFYMRNIVKDDDIKIGKLVLLVFTISFIIVFGFLLVMFTFGVI